MAAQITTNMAGSVGADSTAPAQINFAGPTLPKMVTVSIAGSGNARVAHNTTTMNATTDTIVAGGGTPGIIAAPGGISSISIYADSGETLTYQIVKNLMHLH